MRAFNGEHIAAFFKTLKKFEMPNKPMAIFLDNAKIHQKVPIAAAEKLKMPLLKNMKYRPDLMGIEGFWRHAKQTYKKKIAHLRVNNRPIENWQVVVDSI
jgi:transposase